MRRIIEAYRSGRCGKSFLPWVLKAYAQGQTCRQIADSAGLSQCRIHQILYHTHCVMFAGSARNGRNGICRTIRSQRTEIERVISMLEILMENNPVKEYETMKAEPLKPQTRTDDGQLLTDEEMAERLGVKVRTIRLWRSQRGLPHIKLTAKVIRYRMADIQPWLDSLRVGYR